MSIPSIYGSLLLPQVDEIMAVSCLSSAAHGRVSLKDLASDTKDPPSLKRLTSLLLTLGSLFGQASAGLAGVQGAAKQLPTLQNRCKILHTYKILNFEHKRLQ